MSMLYWIGMFIGSFSLDFHTFVLSIQSTIIRNSSMTDAQKGEQLVDLVKHGMEVRQVKVIFGNTQPLVLSAGPIIEGQYWYFKYRLIIGFDADGKVSAIKHTDVDDARNSSQIRRKPLY